MGNSNSTRFRRRRDEAAARQGYLCIWCDMPMENGDLTGEHLLPRHMGGRTAGNVAAAHFECNQQRGPREDGPSPAYVHMRQVQYLRAQGINSPKIYGWVRANEMPNFGLDLDGNRIWAPQYGIIAGPNATPGRGRRRL